MAHLEWQQPIAGNTRFYLGSEAKPWVALLVMKAVASQKLRLDDDVRRHLPALKTYQQPICVGHLLRHTSGIADYLYLWHNQLAHHEHDLITQAQALELIRRAEAVSFTPGSRYDYSNSNYVLLAELLQQVQGCNLAEIARRGYFAPWEMLDTGFEDQPWRVMPRRARSYERAADAPDAWVDAPVPLASWGDGGLWSSLDDLIRAEQHWHSEWTTPRSANLFELCCTDDSRFAPAGQPYRFGMEVAQHAGRQLVFHGGGYAAFSSLIIRSLEDSMSLIVLSNVDGFDVEASTWIERVWGR